MEHTRWTWGKPWIQVGWIQSKSTVMKCSRDIFPGLPTCCRDRVREPGDELPLYDAVLYIPVSDLETVLFWPQQNKSLLHTSPVRLHPPLHHLEKTLKTHQVWCFWVPRLFQMEKQWDQPGPHSHTKKRQASPSTKKLLTPTEFQKELQRGMLFHWRGTGDQAFPLHACFQV